MNRKFSAAVLALALVFGITISAQATALFPATLVYEEQFVDVAKGDWFHDNVATLYALGLTNGKNSTSTFVPESNMTVAEILTMAARLRSLYEFGSAETGAVAFQTEGCIWYEPYVSYLRSSGVIDREFDGRWNLNATRAEMAHVLANTLPPELLPAINMDAVAVGYATGNYIRDITEYTPYQPDILTLYCWGILSGTDDTGSFCPDAPIRRCEVAAMVTRMVESDLRIVLDWNFTEEDPAPSSLADLVPEAEMPFSAPAPEDTAAVDAALRYMLSCGEHTLTLNYPTAMTEQSAYAVMQAFLSAARCYPEQTYNKVSISYSTTNGKVDLTFSSSLYDPLLLNKYRENIFSAAMQTRETLYNNGTITHSMTEYEKAKVYFEWLCNFCTYDRNANTKSMSHSAYNVFFKKSAVCDGYTAAYNLLLKLEGIQCTAIDNREQDHMWTVARLDGVTYHIDPTWGDQTNTIAYQYFAMTEAYSLARFH